MPLEGRWPRVRMVTLGGPAMPHVLAVIPAFAAGMTVRVGAMSERYGCPAEGQNDQCVEVAGAGARWPCCNDCT
jgi:hypothetical protein